MIRDTTRSLPKRINTCYSHLMIAIFLALKDSKHQLRPYAFMNRPLKPFFRWSLFAKRDPFVKGSLHKSAPALLENHGFLEETGIFHKASLNSLFLKL